MRKFPSSCGRCEKDVTPPSKSIGFVVNVDNFYDEDGNEVIDVVVRPSKRIPKELRSSAFTLQSQVRDGVNLKPCPRRDVPIEQVLRSAKESLIAKPLPPKEKDVVNVENPKKPK